MKAKFLLLPALTKYFVKIQVWSEKRTVGTQIVWAKLLTQKWGTAFHCFVTVQKQQCQNCYHQLL